MSFSGSLALLILLALGFAFVNGYQNSATVVATMISSRAMHPRGALLLAAAGVLGGPLIFGVAVAATIGTGLAPASALTIRVVLAALLSALAWTLLTTWLGIPSSSSHALIGGLAGSVMAGSGWQVLQPSGLATVGVALFLSPILGFAIGWLGMRLLLILMRHATPRANRFFKYGQIPITLLLAAAYGANDAQKTMGVLVTGLVALGTLSQFRVPAWVMLGTALAMAVGTGLGGWRLIRKLGGKFYRIRPIHSFVSQFGSTAVVVGASLLGGPVSSTQVVSSAILGAGAGQRLSQVRWGILGEILLAWLFTLPLTAALSALLYLLLGSLQI